MNRFKVKKLFFKDTLSFLSVILFILALLTGSTIAAEPPIINGKTKMAPGEEQVLSIMNYQTGNTYTWSIQSGGGTLSADSGQSVTYTAPSTNYNCANNPTITASVNGAQVGSISISINQYTGGTRAYLLRNTGCSIAKKGEPVCDNPNDIAQYPWEHACCGHSFNCEGNFQYSLVIYGMWSYSYHPEYCEQFDCYNPNLKDLRTDLMKEQGCCPEVLLPDYEPEDPAPPDVDGSDSGGPPGSPPGNPTGGNCGNSIDQVGNPISIYNGNNFESKIDLSFPSPGGSPFVLKRYYNSKSDMAVNIGYGWTHNFRASLSLNFEYSDNTYLRILDETGRGVYFQDQGGGYYAGAFKERTYVKVEDGNYVWYRLDGRRFVWNSSRYLIRIEEASGNHRTLTYDAGNRLASVADEASGRTLTFNYNSDSRIESVSGPVTPSVPDGIWVQYGYDASGNLISATYADGSGFNYEYNNLADHNLTAKKDKLGHLLSSWTYDSQDRAVTNFTRDGKGVSINYVSGNEVQVTDAYSVTRTYAIWDIDGRKKVTDISAPSGCADCGNEVKRVEYDSQGRVIEIEYANGMINQYADFDSRGYAQTVRKAVDTSDEKTIAYTFHPDIDATLSLTEPSIIGTGSKVTIWDYDDDGNETPNENPTRQVYRLIEQGFTRDATGQVVPFDRITAYTYNSNGQVLTMDGPLPGSQDAIAFSYNASSGDLLAVTRPLTGAVGYSDYDGAGQAGRITDENGNATVLTYDGRGRINTITREADGAVASFSYNIAGSLYKSTDPDGVSTAFAYDTTYGRLIYAQDPLENYLYYGHDSQGNIVEHSIYNADSERRYFRRFSYQGPQHPGKLWQVINPDNTYTEYSYDAGGNIQAVIDPAAKTTFYNYDSLKRLTAVTQPGEIQTVYDYDRNDNLTTVTDAESHRTTYAYDDPGRLLTTNSPDTNASAYVYDNVGKAT